MAGDNMSIENETTEGQQQQVAAEDPIKNLKAEFNRKNDNIANELNSIKQMLQQQAAPKPPPAKALPSADDIDPILDPKAYKDAIRREVSGEVEQKIEYRLSQQDQRTQILGSLVQSYPELSDGSNELTQRAAAILNGMSAEEKNNPRAIKTAVLEAAGELGVLAMSKRVTRQEIDNEDGSFTASSSSSTRRASTQKNKEPDIDPMSLAFAEMLGQNVKDPEYIKRLKTATKRTKWNRWE